MNSIKLDWQFHLVKFQIVFPIIYGFILYSLPSYETFLIAITILLLAETHFGATWPFFLDKVNYPYISQNRIPLIIIPILIVALSTIGFFFVNSFFWLIFFAVSIVCAWPPRPASSFVYWEGSPCCGVIRALLR